MPTVYYFFLDKKACPERSEGSQKIKATQKFVNQFESGTA
jgi:hypothetical protein